MCGIFCSVTDKDDSTIKEILKNETIQDFLVRRGPDHFEKVVTDCHLADSLNEVTLTQLSSVLQLRGKFVCNQPFCNEATGSILQWNGQIFGGLVLSDEAKSDTEQLMTLLEEAVSDQKMLKVIGLIHGPWAFTYWDNRARKLWLGRDILGRRSLCWNLKYSEEMLVITSVAQIARNKQEMIFKSNTLHEKLIKMQFVEIPTTGIYCFDFGSNGTLSEVIANVIHYPWNRNVVGEPVVDMNLSELTLNSPINVKLNLALPPIENMELEKISKCPIAFESIPKCVVEDFENILSSAIGRRCRNHHNVCKKCFARYVKHHELAAINKRKISINGFSSDSDDEVRAIPPSVSTNTVNGITFRECRHASTAILFSGGIDSTVIALLADRHIPANLPIDLLNVAFNDQAPDRETSLRAWNELQQICPHRKWNFVSILVDGEELRRCREKHIKYLVNPSNTVIDDSIGCAVWFATRGSGLLMQDSGIITCAYRTRARVVLLGMGADEQLAGYSRHRGAFGKGENFRRLVEEVRRDISRISTRNLGRDDRITSDHGIEARYPFLDEEVVNFLNGLPIWQKANLRLERGVGEKLLLRLAADKLGLRETSRHLKRAIQFGSRITQFNENGEKGGDKSINLEC